MNKRSLNRLTAWSLPGLCCLLTVAGLQTIPVTSVQGAPDDDTKNSAQKDSNKNSTNTDKSTDRNQDRDGQNAKRAWIGVRLEERDTEPIPGDQSKTANHGVAAVAVYPNGPAARAGLRPGDQIKSINGTKVSSPKEVSNAIGRLQSGATVEMIVRRNNADQNLSVVVGDAAQFQPQYANQGNFQQQSYSYGGQPTNGQGYAQNYSGGNQQGQPGQNANPYDGVPEHAMMLEYQRRNAEQHQRMESQIEQLLQEIRDLRKEVQQLKAK